MKIITETFLWRFEAWSGGEDTLDVLIEKGMCENVESMIEDIFPDGCTDSELNDFLWFERDTIADWLGFDSWEDFEEDNEEEDEDDDNGLPEEANENYEEIANKIVMYDSFEEFCKRDEYGIPDCINCVFGCLNAYEDCEEVFDKFKELEG